MPDTLRFSGQDASPRLESALSMTARAGNGTGHWDRLLVVLCVMKACPVAPIGWGCGVGRDRCADAAGQEGVLSAICYLANLGMRKGMVRAETGGPDTAGMLF